MSKYDRMKADELKQLLKDKKLPQTGVCHDYPCHFSLYATLTPTNLLTHEG